MRMFRIGLMSVVALCLFSSGCATTKRMMTAIGVGATANTPTMNGDSLEVMMQKEEAPRVEDQMADSVTVSFLPGGDGNWKPSTVTAFGHWTDSKGRVRIWSVRFGPCVQGRWADFVGRS